MSWFLTLVLDWLAGKVSSFLAALFAKFARREEIKKQADASVEPLEKAQTAEEIDSAADSALNGF